MQIDSLAKGRWASSENRDASEALGYLAPRGRHGPRQPLKLAIVPIPSQLSGVITLLSL